MICSKADRIHRFFNLLSRQFRTSTFSGHSAYVYNGTVRPFNGLFVPRQQSAWACTERRRDNPGYSWERFVENIVNSAAVKALRDALENEVAALVLKILVEYQVADIAGDPIKID